MSRECCSRIASERQTQPFVPVKPVTPVETPSQGHNPQTVPATRPVKREVTCFTYHQKGHKSLQSPQEHNQVKGVQIPFEKIVPLRDN